MVGNERRGDGGVDHKEPRDPDVLETTGLATHSG